MIIAESLKQALKDQHISASELARRMGVSRAYISFLTLGKVGVTEEKLSSIAEHLGCTVRIDVRFEKVK